MFTNHCYIINVQLYKSTYYYTTLIYRESKNIKLFEYFLQHLSYIKRKFLKYLYNIYILLLKIIFRDTDVIHNEKLDTAMRKVQITHFIARQMASLWYGDVIFWSKNSFTIFFGAYILDQVVLLIFFSVTILHFKTL